MVNFGDIAKKVAIILGVLILLMIILAISGVKITAPIATLLGIFTIGAWFYTIVFQVLNDIFIVGKAEYGREKTRFIGYTIFIVIGILLMLLTNNPSNEIPSTTIKNATNITDKNLLSTITSGISAGFSKTLSFLDSLIDENLGFLKEGIDKSLGWFPRIAGPYLWEGDFWKVENWFSKLLLFDIVVAIWIVACLALDWAIFTWKRTRLVEFKEVVMVSGTPTTIVVPPRKPVIKKLIKFCALYIVGSGLPLISFILDIITLKVLGTPLIIRAFVIAMAIFFGGPYIQRYKDYRTRIRKYNKALESEYLERKLKI